MKEEIDFYHVALEIAIRKGLITNREEASRITSEWDDWGNTYK